MKIMQKQTDTLFGAYDIRGIVGQELDEDFSYRLGQAFGQYLSVDKRATILVGCDARNSSPCLSTYLIKGLIETGNNVVDIGMSSTPLLYWFGAEKNFDGSIVITASHLPPEYNGFKLSRCQAIPISSEDGLKDIASLLLGNAQRRQHDVECLKNTSDTVKGQVKIEHPLSCYVEHLRRYLNCGKHLSIAVDCGNGTAGPEIEALFPENSDSVEIIGIGLVPGEQFRQRPSNPLEKGALDKLIEVVQKHHCAFGVAFDGDADRAIFVDETGETIAPDAITALIGRQLLHQIPDATILYDLRCSRAVPELIKEAGGLALRTKVGHSLIKSAMRRHNAIFAGELSGHYYFKDLYYTDNALRALLEVINAVSSGSGPLSEMVKPMLRYSTSGEINLKVADSVLVLEELAQKFSDGSQDTLDGLSVDYPEWWFNVRASNTEAVLRLTVGAAQPDILKAKTDQLVHIVKASH